MTEAERELLLICSRVLREQLADALDAAGKEDPMDQMLSALRGGDPVLELERLKAEAEESREDGLEAKSIIDRLIAQVDAEARRPEGA